MKNLFIGSVVTLFSAVGFANNYYYPSNPFYCKAEWNCEVISKNFKEAARVCGRDPFAMGTAMVYEKQNGKYVFKGYGCVDQGVIGGP